MSKVQMSVRLRKIRNGENGKDGQSCIKAFVFKRLPVPTDNRPLPTPIGGSFLGGVWVPPDGGWHDGIEPEKNGEPCWMSTRVFTSDGLPPQQSDWSEPVIISSTADLRVYFSANANTPPIPSASNIGVGKTWHETGTPADIWMAVCRITNGQEGDWAISRIKGEDGTSVTIKGTAVAHFTWYDDFEELHGDNGYYLVDEGLQCYKVSTTGISGVHVEQGDGYLVNGNLFVATDDRWLNVGRIQGPQGAQGASAKYVIVSGSQIFLYKDDYQTLVSPESITLTAQLYGGLSGYQWSYKKEGQTAFSNISGGTNSTLTVSPTSALYWSGGAKQCTFRCTSNGYSDEMTIAKVSSGVNGTAVSVILSNESHTFVGEDGHAVAGSTTCSVYAYVNGEPQPSSIYSVAGAPAGMTTATNYNNTESPMLTVNVTNALTQTSGVLDLVILVGDVEVYKQFSWSLSMKGDQGEQGEEGETPFEWQVTPLVLETDERGLVQYSNMGGPLNIAYITGSWKGVTSAVQVKSIGTKYKCDASTASYGTNQGKGGVAINSIACEYFDDEGNKVSSMPAQGGYAIPAIEGYVIARVTFSTTHLLNNISKTYDVNIPWRVNASAYFAKFHHDNRVFYSTIGQVTTQLGEMQTDVSQIRQTANNISLTVGELAKERRNLISGSKLNLVDYRSDRGARYADLTAGRVYLLSVKGRINQELSQSGRHVVANGNMIDIGRLRTTVKFNGTELAHTDIEFDTEFQTVYALLRPSRSGEYVIAHSDYPRYNYSGGLASTPTQCYHVEWEQIEDITDRFPLDWDDMSVYEQEEMLPQLATPWSLSPDDADSGKNMLGEPSFEDEIYEFRKNCTDSKGNYVDGYSTEEELDLGDCHDIVYSIHPMSNQLYTFSFFADVYSGDEDGQICVEVDGVIGACVQSDGYLSNNASFACANQTSGNSTYRTLTAFVDISTSTKMYAITFETATTDVNIRIRGANSPFTICGMKLESGGRATHNETDALLATGIDIRNRQITLTADNVKFQSNQGDLMALINGEGVTAKSFVATDATGVKTASLNEDGFGTLMQFYPDGVSVKFAFGRDGITCYNEDGSIKWAIGLGGLNRTDDWIPVKLFSVNESSGALSQNASEYWLFRSGDSPNSQTFNDTYYLSRGDTNGSKLNGTYAASSDYTVPPPQVNKKMYFKLDGSVNSIEVKYIRTYNYYSGGRRVIATYYLYYNALYEYIGCSRNGSSKYGRTEYV